MAKIGNHQAALTCHLLGGDETTLELGTLKTIYHAIKDLNIKLGAQALTLFCKAENINSSTRPLNIAYDPGTRKFYNSSIPFANKLRRIQSVIFYILCRPGAIEQFPLHVIASHQGDEFEYYPLRISREVLLDWKLKAKKRSLRKT